MPAFHRWCSILYVIHMQNGYDYNISLLVCCLASLSSSLHSATSRSRALFFCWSSRISFLHSISSLFLASRLSSTALGLPVPATSSESVVSELLCWRELISADAPFSPKRFSVRVSDVSILHERRMWSWCLHQYSLYASVSRLMRTWSMPSIRVGLFTAINPVL